MRHLPRSLRLVLVALCALAPLLAAALPADAYWRTSGSGSAVATTASMPAGNQPATAVAGRNVTISWAQSTFQGKPIGGYAGGGYTVVRYAAGSSTGTAPNAGCAAKISGTTASLQCVEDGVPAGDWQYGVVPVLNTFTGSQSPRSATVTVGSPQLSFTSSTSIATLPATLAGSISAFKAGQSVTFRLDDPAAGPVLTGSISPTPVPANGASSVSVTVPAGTSAGAHTVHAIGDQGDTASATITVLTASLPPMAPSVLTATAASSSQVNLTWMDTSDNETGFKIERSPAGAGTWTLITTAAANATSYTDSGLAAATTYDYRVKATNAGGDSAASNVASATTSSTCSATSSQTIIAARDSRIHQSFPNNNYGNDTGLWVRSGSDNARVLVHFTLPAIPSGCTVTEASLRLNASSAVAGRTIQVFRAAGAWTETGVTWNNQPATTGTAATAASATGWNTWAVTTQVQASYTGTNDGFSVRDSVDGAASTTQQTYASREATTNKPELVVTFGNSAPSAPSNLTASPASSSQVNLAWFDGSNTETGFKVERSPAGANTWTAVTTTAANATSYADSGLAAGTSYDYRVRATNGAGDSAASNVASATTRPPTLPTAPSGLTATAASSSQLNLTWVDGSDNETGFKIERSPAGTGTWTVRTTTAANATSYADTGLATGTTYDYRVKATNGAGDSAASNVATGTTGTCTSASTQTVIAGRDSQVLQSAPTSNLNDSSFSVSSSGTSNLRSFVGFTLPAIPSGCTVTGATLRLNAVSATAGRTMQVFRAAGTWTETGVTWSNQPAPAGTAATATSATGWNTWAVTSQVQSMYTGTNDGFLVRDAVEGAATAVTQTYAAREASTLKPELVLTFG